MSDFFVNIWNWFSNSVFASAGIFIDIIDIAIMTTVIYQILKFFKNTRAMNVLKGVAILIVALAFASWLQLPTITWLLSSVFTSGIVVIVILFQPELRMVFENFGRSHFTDSKATEDEAAKLANEFVKACENLSKRRVGALIVFERKTPLKDIQETGTLLDANVSAGLIENVFEPNTPLHDGAMIVSGTKIVSAGCFLPLSDNPTVDKALGTRHRAALGLSERTDATVIVVSEETGVISCARSGSFMRYLDLETLRQLLTDIYAVDEETVAKNRVMTLFNKFFGKEHSDEN